MPTMFENIPVTTATKSSHEMSFRYQTLLVHILRKRIQWHIWLETAHTNAHRSPAIQVQFVRKIIHTTLLIGIALSKGAWRSTSIRIQRAPHKGTYWTDKEVFCWYFYFFLLRYELLNFNNNKKKSFFFSQDVRLWRMRPHNERARSTLLTFEDKPSIFTGSIEILRQTSFQIHEFNIRQQLIGSTANACPQLKWINNDLPASWQQF